MTITLSDIPAAVEAYLADNVTITLTEVEADSGSLNPNEEGTYTMTVANAAAPNGLALRNVVYHLESTRPAKVLLKVPGSAILFSRDEISSSAPLLTRNSFVPRMFVTRLDGELGVGEVQEFTFEVRGEDEGRSEITAHIHAEIDEDALFARQHGPTSRVEVRVQ
jgi:hypothetical protein